MKSTLEICHSSLSAETIRLKLNTPVLPANAARSEIWQASYYLAKKFAIESTDWIALLGQVRTSIYHTVTNYGNELIATEAMMPS
jgi:hypothetical protein